MYVRDSIRYEVLRLSLFGAKFEVVSVKTCPRRLLMGIPSINCWNCSPSAECNQLFDFELLVRVAIKNWRPFS